MIYKKTNKRMSELVDEEPIVNDEAAGLEQATLARKKCAPRKKGGLLLVILVVALLWYVLGAYTGLALPGFSKMRPSNDWQAIFLNNGQVYFGKIKNVTSRELVLTNIYYLQVITRPLQATQEGSAEQVEQNQQTQQELTLIKLGNELHGPTDKMVINRDYILLTEALKNDSQVVKAIDASFQK
ncbi:MAG TPA: hypothetical protein PKL09_00535 [bacterium]|nr:hypothetical protein [bacterium]HNS33906.1 hypothetical protein [bacterium]HNW09158.1 hypothetical protein [bacterium]HPN80950.1 hypothetical protein [bacterium]HPW39388.1 hypothetical protein [bacterium]